MDVYYTLWICIDPYGESVCNCMDLYGALYEFEWNRMGLPLNRHMNARTQ